MRAEAYRAIAWNRFKIRADLAVVAALALFAAVYAGISWRSRGDFSAGVLALRTLAVSALLLMHLVLAIGPLSRLDSRFLPLLYMRRHLGVITFTLAAAHGAGSAILYHYNAEIGIIASLLLGNGSYQQLANFPFEVLGLAALLLLVPLAATSHDFWLQALTVTVWKRLHMLVYVSYFLVLAHVLLGILQSETNPMLLLLLAMGAGTVLGLHLLAGFQATQRDRAGGDESVFGYVDLCSVTAIPEGEARAFPLVNERICVIRSNDHISAISNICEHQAGPLGEGILRDGCITCPWHGKRYHAQTGLAADGDGGVPTFHLRISQGRVLVDPLANPPGEPMKPALVPESLRSRPA